VTKEDIIEAIGNLTVIELADLVKDLEEKFGVSAAAPVAMAVAGGPVGAEAAPEEEEKTEFDVLLSAIGDQKIQVIKAVRELTSLGLREAKAVVDEAPSEVLKALPKDQAEAAKKRLEEAGATAEIK
jgi:large subunit ribosomal protein L7/L12